MSHLYNEINPYRARVLRARMAEGRLPSGTVDERDITTIPDQDFLGFDQVHLFAGIGGFPLGLALAGVPDGLRCVTGGFPCQDISNAGNRTGITGERSGLWREMVRAIRVVRPDLVFVENVAALLGRGMGRVVGDLAAIGYDAKWTRVSAADVGAWHLRERIWIAAYAAIGNDWVGHSRESQRQEPESRNSLGATNISYAGESGLPQSEQEAVLGTWRREERRATSERDRWPSEPDVGRMAHGIPARVDRLAALGDAIVPQACAEAIRRMMA